MCAYHGETFVGPLYRVCIPTIRGYRKTGLLLSTVKSPFFLISESNYEYFLRAGSNCPCYVVIDQLVPLSLKFLCLWSWILSHPFLCFWVLSACLHSFKLIPSVMLKLKCGRERN